MQQTNLIIPAESKKLEETLLVFRQQCPKREKQTKLRKGGYCCGIKITLEKTKPELAADLMENGIMLTGGGALLKGLDLLVKEETGMPVFIAEYPLDCVAIGTGKSVEDQEIFEKVLVANKRR